VKSVCVSPAFESDRTLAATTVSDGVYLSTDGGSTWHNISAGLPTQELGRAACGIDGASRLVLLVAGLERGLARTDDLGGSWSVVQDTVAVTALELSPDFATNGLAVAGDGLGNVYYSVDAGVAWARLTTLAGVGQVFDIELAPGGGTAYVATNAGLYRTTNGGQTFDALSQCLPAGPILAVDVSPDFVNDQTVFAATGDDGVFVSADRGECWTKHQEGIEFDTPLLTQYRFFDIELSASFAADRTAFTAIFEGLFRSTDGGSSWLQLETKPRNSLLEVALSPGFDHDATVALARYGGGAAISFDSGETWTVANTGIDSPFFYDIVFSPDFATDETLFGINAGHKPLMSTDRGTTWSLGAKEPGYFPTVMEVSPNFAVDGTLFVASRGNGIARSEDGGQTWTQVLPDSNRIINGLFASPAYATDGTVFAARQVEGVFRSVDGGDTWQPMNDGLPLDGDRGPLLAISPSFAWDGVVLAGTLQGLYRSGDAGATWLPSSTQPVATMPIEAVAISPAFATSGLVLASVRGTGLYQSADGGDTWSALAEALIESQTVLHSIRFSPAFATDRTLFGFSGSTLLRSSDAGATWQAIDTSPVRHESDRPAHQWNFYEGTWIVATWAQASARRLHWSQQEGSRARFLFFGTGVTWLGARGDFLGVAEVYVDGVLEAEVDQYGAALEPRVELFEKAGLPLGLHEIEVVVTGRKHPNATALGATVDAFDVVQ
jgi:photosystem II stability/assembly factor-like uncharacterized protein